MILDAHELEDGSVLAGDICIVGAGAAGISIALQFLHGPTRIILLESGGLTAEAETSALYRGEVADEKLHSPASSYRERRFGGSTTIWGGRCMPLDPIDFEKRPWIPGSGWPFGRETLDPWYPEANALCEAGDFAYTAEAAFPHGMRRLLERFEGERFTDNTLERFSCPTDFGRRYRRRLESSAFVRAVLHANVTDILMNETGSRVWGVDAATLRGRRFRVEARHFVLATGGLEIPRLLLASNAVQKHGIGNAHDQVGRNYMCHIAGTIGELRVTGGANAVSYGYQVAEDGVYCRRRLALAETAQRELRAGNFIARLHHPRIPDPRHGTGALSALYFARPFISYEYAKRLHGEGGAGIATNARHLVNLLRDPWSAIRFGADWLKRRILADRKFPSIIVPSRTSTYSIDFHAEQVPNPVSRISLGAGRDALGLRRIHIDWRHDALDIRTVRLALRALANDLARSGCGRLAYDETTLESEILRDGAYGGHHIGTARMAADPRRGVVDADCRVHGVANLYLAGSAVFPTSGQANPTLTIVALALRLASHLQSSVAELEVSAKVTRIFSAACIR